MTHERKLWFEDAENVPHWDMRLSAATDPGRCLHVHKAMLSCISGLFARLIEMSATSETGVHVILPASAPQELSLETLDMLLLNVYDSRLLASGSCKERILSHTLKMSGGDVHGGPSGLTGYVADYLLLTHDARLRALNTCACCRINHRPLNSLGLDVCRECLGHRCVSTFESYDALVVAVKAATGRDEASREVVEDLRIALRNARNCSDVEDALCVALCFDSSSFQRTTLSKGDADDLLNTVDPSVAACQNVGNAVRLSMTVPWLDVELCNVITPLPYMSIARAVSYYYVKRGRHRLHCLKCQPS